MTVADILGRSIANLGESLARRNDSVVKFAKSITSEDALSNLGKSLTRLGDSISDAQRADVATPLPKALAARHIKAGADTDGHVAAFRGLNGAEPAGSGEYLFVTNGPATLPVWLSVKDLELA